MEIFQRWVAKLRGDLIGKIIPNLFERLFLIYKSRDDSLRYS
jgi:hypothetical protein